MGEHSMSDPAFENATKRRDSLASEINDLQQTIDSKKRELSKVDTFINEWKLYASGPIPDDLAVSKAASSLRANIQFPQNPPKEKVGEVVRALIKARQHPISRNMLFKALQVEGIHLQGKDPVMVLSTMLWRMSDQFARLNGYGYWNADEDYPPANYVAPARSAPEAKKDDSEYVRREPTSSLSSYRLLQLSVMRWVIAIYLNLLWRRRRDTPTAQFHNSISSGRL
jgi:YesN/AraC family two-component response regulator